MVLTVEPPPPNLPVGGSPCPHPPNTPPSGDLELRIEEDKPHPPTKSPDSQWILKWACLTSPGPEAHAHAPFLAPITLPSSSLTQQPPISRSLEEPAPSIQPPPATSQNVPVDLLKHLKSLVDSVLAAVVIIQAATSQPVILSPHTQRALKLLNKFATPTSATTCSAPQPKPQGHTTCSYAQAMTGSPSTQMVEKKAKPSSAGHQPSCNHTHPRSLQQPC